MTNPSTLREALKERVLFWNGDFNEKELDDYIDVFIAVIPEAHLPEDFENYDGFPRGEIAGRFNATLEILKHLQSAKGGTPQQTLIDVITSHDFINKAAEGSMQKRQDLIDRVEGTE